MSKKIKVHISKYPNQHGWSVSLIETDDESGELLKGFTLNNFESEYEQKEYGKQLSENFGYEIDRDHC